MACRVKIFWNLKKIYPGNLLKIGYAGFLDTLYLMVDVGYWQQQANVHPLDV